MKTLNYVKTCFFVLLIFSMISTQAQTIVEQYGRLKVTGNKVTAEDGTPISLAGMSLFWSNAGDTSDFYNAETVNYLVDEWDISIIRVAMGVQESWDNGNGYIGSPAAQKTKIRKVIDAAIAKGIYVIIDWHTHDTYARTNQNTPSVAEEFFKDMANIYGTYDNVIYEVFNEPIDQSWSEIKSYAEEVIDDIRAEDPDNLIIVGTRTWSQRVDEASLNPINDANLAYTLHFYSGTHQGDDPGSVRDNARKAMSTTNGYNGVAIFVTEFGTVNADGGGAVNQTETEKWISFLRDNDISYVNWAVSDKPEGSAVIQPGSGINGLQNDQLTVAGTYIKSIIADQNVLEVNDLTLNGELLKVYPSPFENYITINAKSPIDAITVYDMTGRVILSETINKLNPNISLGSLIPGNYILSIASNGSNASTIITRSK